MFNRVVMNIIHVSGEIYLINYLVLPIPALPDRPFTLCRARKRAWTFKPMVTAGEIAFYQADARWIIGIVTRQGPDAMDVVGHHDKGI
jgi:hypothetical protein